MHNLKEVQEKFLIPAKDIIENQKYVIYNPSTLMEMSTVIGNYRYIDSLAHQLKKNAITLQKQRRRRKSSLPSPQQLQQLIEYDLPELQETKSIYVDDLLEIPSEQSFSSAEQSFEFENDRLMQVPNVAQKHMDLLEVPERRRSRSNKSHT